MRPQVVLFGDSITEQSFRAGGWGAALADNYSRKADIFNRGYGGYNTRWALFLLHHIFPLQCNPAMLVILITPPPIDEDGRMEYACVISLHATRSIYADKAMKEPERTIEVIGTYAKQCVELAEELSVPSINLWSKMQQTEGWQKKFLSDGLHLTAEGNGVVSKEVVRVFNQAGLYAADMPYDFPHHSEIDGKNPEKAFQIQCS